MAGTTLPANHVSMTLGEIADATGGTLHDGAADTVIDGVSTDTRQIAPGALFVALVGPRFDGHRFVDGARERGAAAVLAQRGSGVTGARVEVEDTLAALGALAHRYVMTLRARGPFPIAVIGGAAGKTTTRALTHAVTSALFGAVHATHGNLNNLIGVPMTLFGLGPSHRAAVIECGTNTRGEIARLGAIVGPDVALILNTGVEHTEGLGSIEQAADEEAAMLEHATRASVINADDPRLLARRGRSRVPVFTFGEGAGVDVQLVQRTLHTTGRSTVTFAVAPRLRADDAPEMFTLEIGLAGHAAAVDTAAALATGVALWGRPLGRAEWSAIGAALAQVQPVAGRLMVQHVGGLTLIDDSYNANPRSVLESIHTARELARAGSHRLMVALGDMLELGALEDEAHRAVVEALLAERPTWFVGVGPAFRTALLGADVVSPSMHAAVDAAHASELLAREVRAGDVVLVKGSRGVGMDRVVDGVRAAMEPHNG